MTPPSCIATRAALEALIDGELPARQAALLQAHLNECPDCRRHYAEAVSLPHRLSVIRGPQPPPTLVAGVLHQVRADRTRPFVVWGLLAAEILLVAVAGWYLSGVGGLLSLGGRTATDVGGWLNWFAGQADLPGPSAGDVFLVLISGLLVLVTLLHLALLARQGSARAS